jgi:hypothetical protein
VVVRAEHRVGIGSSPSMGGRRRLALEITLLGVAFACIWAFLYVAPAPQSCPSISCPGFDSGAVRFLGSDRYTFSELLGSELRS